MPPPSHPSPAAVLDAFVGPLRGRRLPQGTIGPIGIKVHGRGGGEWVLDPSQEEPLAFAEGTGVFARCPTRLYAFADVLPALVLAPTQVPHLLETGELVVEGDRTALTRLAQLLSSKPSQAPKR